MHPCNRLPTFFEVCGYETISPLNAALSKNAISLFSKVQSPQMHFDAYTSGGNMTTVGRGFEPMIRHQKPPPSPVCYFLLPPNLFIPVDVPVHAQYIMSMGLKYHEENVLMFDHPVVKRNKKNKTEKRQQTLTYKKHTGMSSSLCPSVHLSVCLSLSLDGWSQPQ